jgi:hypothetical protein
LKDLEVENKSEPLFLKKRLVKAKSISEFSFPLSFLLSNIALNLYENNLRMPALRKLIWWW